MAEGGTPKRTGRGGKRRGPQPSAPTTFKVEDEKEEDREALCEKSEEKTKQNDKEGTKRKKKKKKKKMETVKKIKEVAKDNQDSYLPRQKCDTLDERDPLRIFLETLYQQLPDDELAASWMMDYGLLPLDEAKKLYEKIHQNDQQELESPSDSSCKKTATPAEEKVKLASKKSPKTEKRKAIEEGRCGDDPGTKLLKKKIKKHRAST